MSQRRVVVFACGALAAVTALPAAHAGKGPSPGLVELSGSDPVAANCHALYREGFVVEPHIAADPSNPLRMYAAWGQDRGTGTARSMLATSGDGGRSWTPLESPTAVSTCDGGAVTRTGSADDWLSIGGDGTVYHAALSLDPGAATAIQLYVEVSRDGGGSWSTSRVPTGPAPDKEVIAADPLRPGVAYVAWCDIGSDDSFPVRVSRTTDWGRTWSSPVGLPHDQVGSQDTNAQLGVLPDGSLLAVYQHFDLAVDSVMTVKAVQWKAADDWGTWSDPMTLSGVIQQGAAADGGDNFTNVDNVALAVRGDRAVVVWSEPGASLRSPSSLRTMEFSPGSGWTDGPSWSSSAAMVLPAIAIDKDGRTGLIWYDFRDDTRSDDGVMTATLFGTVIGADSQPTALTAPFDVADAQANSANTGGSGAFVGDYVGMAATRGGFVAAVSLAGADYADHGPTDIYAARLRDDG